MSKLKWCIKRSTDNYKEVNEWGNNLSRTLGNVVTLRDNRLWVHYDGKGVFSQSFALEGFHEINLDEFRLLTNPEEYEQFSVYAENIKSYLSFHTGYGPSVYSPTPLANVVSKPVADELMTRWKEKEFYANPIPGYLTSVKFGDMERPSVLPIQSITIDPQPVSEERKKEMENLKNSCTWPGLTFDPRGDVEYICPKWDGEKVDDATFEKLWNETFIDEAEKIERPVGGSYGKPKGWKPLNNKAPDPFEDPILKAELMKAIESGKGVGYGYDGENEFQVDTFDSDYALQEVIEILKKHFVKPLPECNSNQIMPGIDRMYLQGFWYVFDKERNEYVKDENQEP